MQKFYFDFTNNNNEQMDETGTSFNSMKEARAAAIRLLPDVAQTELPDGDRHVFGVRIRNEAGQYLFHATLSLIAQDLTPPDINAPVSSG